MVNYEIFEDEIKIAYSRTLNSKMYTVKFNKIVDGSTNSIKKQFKKIIEEIKADNENVNADIVMQNFYSSEGIGWRNGVQMNINEYDINRMQYNPDNYYIGGEDGFNHQFQFMNIIFLPKPNIHAGTYHQKNTNNNDCLYYAIKKSINKMPFQIDNEVKFKQFFNTPREYKIELTKKMQFTIWKV
jgi:hypothetical protein